MILMRTIIYRRDMLSRNVASIGFVLPLRRGENSPKGEIPFYPLRKEVGV